MPRSSPTAPTTGRKCIWISCPTGRAKPSSAAAWDSPGGTYNGGKASGTVWYDNAKVCRTPAPEEALYTREGEHIVLKLDRDKVTVSDADIDAWLSKLDRTYEAYRDLVGDVPFDGRKIMTT